MCANSCLNHWMSNLIFANLYLHGYFRIVLWHLFACLHSLDDVFVSFQGLRLSQFCIHVTLRTAVIQLYLKLFTVVAIQTINNNCLKHLAAFFFFWDVNIKILDSVPRTACSLFNSLRKKNQTIKLVTFSEKKCCYFNFFLIFFFLVWVHFPTMTCY